MGSYKAWLLQYIVRPMMVLSCLFFSSLSISQELSDTLILRLGPGIGFPVNIELPSGAFIDVEQRRNDWLLILDHRGEGGWATIDDVETAGGLADRQAWRLTELKQDDLGSITGRLYQQKHGYGVSLGWRLPKPYGAWLVEVEKNSDAVEVWQAVSSWYQVTEPVRQRAYYGAGIGIGYSWESSYSNIFSEEGESGQNSFVGVELLAGYKPVKRMDTGFSLRHLEATSTNASTQVISWFWSFGI